MGLSMIGAAQRATREAGHPRRIIGVSRFSNPQAREALEAQGIETHACDLLDETAVRSLPTAANVIFLAGRKFGTAGQEDLTWASNTILPATVCEHYRESRIVAFSTGCVYPVVDVKTGGATEQTPPEPVGEYSMSCLGRERMFDYYSRTRGEKVLQFRLNYSVELRYGVLQTWPGRSSTATRST